MAEKAVKHENFFVAKNRDSESARAVFRLGPRLASCICAHQSLDARVTKMAVAQALPALLTNDDVDPCGVFRIVLRRRRDVYDRRARRAAGSCRQHFLKRDAVFFDVLVYSG
jgi:hypothetical protein